MMISMMISPEGLERRLFAALDSALQRKKRVRPGSRDPLASRGAPAGLGAAALLGVVVCGLVLCGYSANAQSAAPPGINVLDSHVPGNQGLGNQGLDSQGLDPVTHSLIAQDPTRPDYKEPAPNLPVLTTAFAAHSLTTEEASRPYRVHLRGVVTCIDPSTGPHHAAVFLHDASGTIYVMVPDRQKSDFPAGTIIDVQGVTSPGTGAPIIDFTRVRAIGHAELPPDPPREDLFHLETGAQDGKWVQVEGTIHSFFVHHQAQSNFKYVTLQLAMVGGTIGVSVLWEPGVDYSSLVDARVSIRGNAAPLFNRNDQIIGARLMAPGMSTLKIVEAAPSDPFTQPITLVDDLLRWNLISRSLHRVHLQGNVTLRWPGALLCIRDATRGICTQTVQDTHVALGELTDVVGFAEADNGTTVLTDATFRAGAQGHLIPAKPVTAEEALVGKDDSELVQIEGQLIGSDQASSEIKLLLSSGNIIFTAMLPKTLAPAGTETWKIGSKLRVTGICSVSLDVQSNAVGKGVAEAKSFQLLMRSPDDAYLVQRPSWWTSGHALTMLSVLVAAVVGAFGWITLLRRRVHLQMADLQKAHEEASAINELALAMQEVTSKGKLTARVSASGSEQIAQLGIGFNRMLSELEEGELATRRAEAKLQHQALTDELTGLPNRRSLSERLAQSLAIAQREGRTVGLLFIDLDGFKSVNDSLGHRVGDLLLVEVCRRLQSRIRQADTLARLGGDEFTVVLTSIRAAREAEIVAETLLEVLSEPFQLEGTEVVIGASIGISIYPQDGNDTVTLLKQADSAMYAAKGNGKNQARRFTPELGSRVRERVGLESRLRGAIGRGEIHLHYQPAFDLATQRLTRFEALARWTHPLLGSVPPGKFIPVAEESGLIVSLGAYVLHQACIEAVKWQAISASPIQVAVNVSSLQFARVTFVDEVAHTLRASGLRPELLQIELTESIMLTGRERASETMRALRELGISLAIDDFGTGYSCLSYLPSLPFDTMKIDRSFVQELGSDSGARSVVSFLIELAHSMKMQVIVEGVETVEQLAIIKALNGNEIQGFLLGRPIADPQSLLAERGLMRFNTDVMVELV